MGNRKKSKITEITFYTPLDGFVDSSDGLTESERSTLNQELLIVEKKINREEYDAEESLKNILIGGFIK